MTRISVKPILGTVALGALLAGCATTVDMGPGYYHYDVGVARSAPPASVVVNPEPTVVYREPAVVYREPTVVYREPSVVYRDSPVVYREPSLIYYRSPRYGFPYNDHGQ